MESCVPYRSSRYNPECSKVNLNNLTEEENKMKKLNVGMIGGGFMGKAHALAYAGLPMFFWPAPAIPHRHTIVDVTDELAKEAAQRLGFENYSSDWRAVVEDP